VWNPPADEAEADAEIEAEGTVDIADEIASSASVAPVAGVDVSTEARMGSVGRFWLGRPLSELDAVCVLRRCRPGADVKDELDDLEELETCSLESCSAVCVPDAELVTIDLDCKSESATLRMRAGRGGGPIITLAGMMATSLAWICL